MPADFIGEQERFTIADTTLGSGDMNKEIIGRSSWCLYAFFACYDINGERI